MSRFTKPQKSSSTPNLSSKICQNKTTNPSSNFKGASSKSHDTWKKTNPELKDSKIIKEELDLAECQKQFHASPVPEQVFKTNYNEIVKEQELKSLEGRQQRREFLLSTQKPFTFYQKEDGKTKEINPDISLKSQSKNRKPAGEARTRTQAVTDSNISEKLKGDRWFQIVCNRDAWCFICSLLTFIDFTLEKEQRRKIRIQIRAQETLRVSTAPIQSQSTRANLQASTTQITKNKLLGFLQQTPSFQPKINTKVPDFDKLYQVFQKEMMTRVERKEVTICQPFQLHTSALRQRNSRSSLDQSAVGLPVLFRFVCVCVRLVFLG